MNQIRDLCRSYQSEIAVLTSKNGMTSIIYIIRQTK